MPFELHELARLSAALLTPTIAAITTYVAVQQYRMARAKKELELYDRRLAIYKNTQHIIYFCFRGNIVTQDKYGEWLDSVAEAEFLFGKEVVVLLDRLSEEVCDHMGASDPEIGMDDPDEQARVTLRINGYYGVVKQVFAPYLNLRYMAGFSGRHLSAKKVAELLKPLGEERKEDKKRKEESIQRDSPDEDVPF